MPGAEGKLVGHASYRAIVRYKPGHAQASECGGYGGGGGNIRNVFKESGGRVDDLGPHRLKLLNKLLQKLILNNGDCELARLVSEEVAVVGALKMQLQICMGRGRGDTY
jgi:hypothetical protein